MLGPQGGASSARQESDPEKVSSFEPRPTIARNWLFAVLAVAMATACVLLVFSDRPGVIERWILGVGAVFFSYCAFHIVRRAGTRRLASLDRRGLWFDGPDSRKVIEWDNIERTSVYTISSQRFTVIALREPQRLIEQYDEAEARAAVNQENVTGIFGAALGLGGEKSPDLAAVFARRRTQYGGEVWLSMHDRERSAEEFDALLNAWWTKYRKETS